MIELDRLWLLPPLGIGRLGSAARPSHAYSWARARITPKGSAKTVLVPEDTIEVAANGVPSLRPASAFNRIELKDAQNRFFPVCPIFELHGAWKDGGIDHEGAITEAVLAKAGLSVADVSWSIEVANLKAFHYTLQDTDRIVARLAVRADDTTAKDLDGLTPAGDAALRLVPGPTAVKLGRVQVIKSTTELPGLRFRVYAPAGVVYAPTNIDARIPNTEWANLQVDPARKIVNPNSKWATYRFGADAPGPLPRDGRVSPGGLAAALRGVSLGLLDDVSDGLITCVVGTLAPAHARIAIGPPDFSPASRPFVSLQDGLSDRTRRADVDADDLTMEELEEVVADIFERALETSSLINKDAQNQRTHDDPNAGVTLPPPSADFESPPVATLWARGGTPADVASQVDALPVSFRGDRKHRRLNALEYLKDRLRDDPTFVEKWLRPPRDQFPYYDRRMPALMRGSDGHAMHMTRRQYDLIKRWASTIAAGEEN